MSIPRILPLVFCLLSVISAQGANDLFLNISGVPGESRDSNHPNQIEVLAWSWGLSNPATAGTGGTPRSGIVQIQELFITKYLDKSSPVLMLGCSKGTIYSTVTLSVRKSGATRDYLVVTLSDVLVTSISTGGSGGEDRLTENLSLNFTKVKLDYYEQKPDGTYNSTPITYNWNILTNSES